MFRFRTALAVAIALALLAHASPARATSFTPSLPLALEGDESVATTDETQYIQNRALLRSSALAPCSTISESRCISAPSVQDWAGFAALAAKIPTKKERCTPICGRISDA